MYAPIYMYFYHYYFIFRFTANGTVTKAEFSENLHRLQIAGMWQKAAAVSSDVYSILINAQILQIRGLDLLMNDVYNPLEARLLKYFNYTRAYFTI